MKITLKINWATKHPKEPFWSFEIDEKELAKQLREQNYDLWIPKPEERFCECPKSFATTIKKVDYPSYENQKEYVGCVICGLPIKPQPKAEFPEELAESGLSYKNQDIELVDKINQIIRYLRENKC